MASIVTGFEQLVGGTPLMRLKNYENRMGCHAEILAKIEFFNPTSSIKDRAAMALIADGEKKGLIGPKTLIIEPTSGNTGVGLAALCAAKGYRMILIMPETASEERKMLMRAFGAELILTPGEGGMQAAVEEAERIHRENPDSFIAGQFDNPAYPNFMEQTAAKELLDATDGKIDFFVSAAGTGGTLTGIGRGLRAVLPNVSIICVEPADSPLLSKGYAGPHKIQGIGANFVPKNLDVSLINEIFTATTQEAYQAARSLATTEGLLCGISSGAALHAATLLAKRPENAGKRIVVILPDTGERYLSTDLYR